MQDKGKIPVSVLVINALSIALVAVLATQVLHEVCHGLAALLMGARWRVQWLCFCLPFTRVEAF